MGYIIGIDGGGTKTHCIITGINGKKLFECFGNASNFLVRGTEEVSLTIYNLVNECKNNLNINYDEIEAVLIGSTGAGRIDDAQKLESDFKNYAKSKGIRFKLFRVESDARIALEGAFSGKPGSILIAGTGSIMFGKDGKGNIHRVGGFGRFIGDEGSGYAIGKKGLTAVSKEFDGRGKHSLVTSLIAEKFKIDSSEVLINKIYKNNFNIASIAPSVFAAAEKDDEAALKIIDEETNELLLHIETMLRKIELPILDVVFIGGIITNENIYSKILRNKIKNKLEKVNIKEPDYPPEMGAVLMAQEILKASKVKL